MNEKKRQIIEAAIRLFAQKGYHATSIQEIADTLGIAKGSLYFYFKSKEDLFVSVFEYHIDQILQQFHLVSDDKSLSPRDKMFKLLMENFDRHRESRDFFQMLMKERFEINEEIGKLILNLRAQSLSWYQTCIIEMYGAEGQSYSLDAAMMFSAMTVEYMHHLTLDNIEYETKPIALYLLERLDDLMRGMIAKGQPPLLSPDRIHQFLPAAGFGIASEIHQIRSLLASLGLPPDRREEIESSLLVLNDELAKAEPQPVIIKGMIAYLHTLALPELKPHLDRIAALAVPSQ